MTHRTADLDFLDCYCFQGFNCSKNCQLREYSSCFNFIFVLFFGIQFQCRFRKFVQSKIKMKYLLLKCYNLVARRANRVRKKLLKSVERATKVFLNVHETID